MSTDSYIDITQISIRHHISERQVRRYVKAGLLKPLEDSHKAGRYVFDLKKVDAWFAQNRPVKLPMAPPIEAKLLRTAWLVAMEDAQGGTAQLIRLLSQAWENMTESERGKLTVSLQTAANRSIKPGPYEPGPNDSSADPATEDNTKED